MEAKDMVRLDADGSIFFTRQLEAISSRILEEPLEPLEYARFIPVSTEFPAGATNLTWREYKGYGQARMISDYAHDFPRSEVAGVEHTITQKPAGTSYGFSIMEIKRAQFAGVDLEARKARAAMRALEELIDRLAWNGDADYGIQGFLNYPGVNSFTPAGADANAKKWVNKTADQIIDDLNNLVLGVDVPTNGIERINTILLPKAQMNIIKNKRVSSVSDLTVYEWFKRNNPEISIEVLRSLKDAGGAGVDMIIGYDRSPEKLEFHLPVAMEMLEPEKKGLEYVVPMIAQIGGVTIYRPLSVIRGTGL